MAGPVLRAADEVPFCGHATIALGAALADRLGNGVFQLQVNDTAITVEGRAGDAGLHAALHSPPTRSENVGAGLLDRVLSLFGYRSVDLDPRLPPRVVEAGARHLALALSDRRQLAAMRYGLDRGRELMLAHGLSLLHAETPSRFHARNPFAAGGVYEATGAAAAAWAGPLAPPSSLRGPVDAQVGHRQLSSPRHSGGEQLVPDMRSRERGVIWQAVITSILAGGHQSRITTASPRSPPGPSKIRRSLRVVSQA